MPLYDYECVKCGHCEESIQPPVTPTIECSKCGEVSEKYYTSCAKTLTTIIPAYPGCKKNKAGYVHTHGDKPRSRVQGCGFSPSD